MRYGCSRMEKCLIDVPNSYSRSASSGIVSIAEIKIYLFICIRFRHDSYTNIRENDIFKIFNTFENTTVVLAAAAVAATMTTTTTTKKKNKNNTRVGN